MWAFGFVGFILCFFITMSQRFFWKKAFCTIILFGGGGAILKMFSSWKSQVNHHEITPEIYRNLPGHDFRDEWATGLLGTLFVPRSESGRCAARTAVTRWRFWGPGGWNETLQGEKTSISWKVIQILPDSVWRCLYDVLRMCHDRSVMCVAIILRSRCIVSSFTYDIYFENHLHVSKCR